MKHCNIALLFMAFMLAMPLKSNSAEFDFNLGFSFTSAAVGLYRINDRINDYLTKNGEKEDLRNAILNLQSGFRYNVYSQFGARLLESFSLGSEILVNFNTFNLVNENLQTINRVYTSGFYTRFYTKLDFIIGALTVLTGPQLNFLSLSTTNTPLKWVGWDLGARLSLGWLMVETFYVFDIYNERKDVSGSDLIVGVGLEFSIV